MRRFIILIFLFSVVVSTAVDQIEKINRNLAHLSFVKAMSANTIKATDRQEKLKHFVTYLHHSQDKVLLSPSVEAQTESTMLRSIFIGEYHRFQGDIDEAAQWYLQATQSDPFPSLQNSLSYARRKRLLPNGDILITDFSDVDGWQPDLVNYNVESITFDSTDGIALISYPNHLDRRDIVTYLLYPPGAIQLGYHIVLSMRVKMEPGSFLTMSVKVDDVLERHLNYYQGTGNWETLKFPLTGDLLQAIFLSFSEPGKPPTEVSTYNAWIDWMQLELALD